MKVKNVLVRFEMEGRGIVNFDHSSQKFMFIDEGNGVERSRQIKSLSSKNDNVTYAKKAFFRNEDGGLNFDLKISSECFKKALFDRDYISDNPSIMHFDSLLYNFIGSIPGQLRGYMFAGEDDVFKRKGSINVTDVIQTCNAQSYLDFHSKATNRNDEGEKTSLYASENVGDVKYSGMGNIDLKNLQFLSCDAVFDRRGFNEDKYDILKEVLSKNIKSFSSELGYHKLKNSAVDIPEFGIMYNNEDVLLLVKEYLHRLLEVEIKRKNAFAKVTKVEIKLVQDVFEDTHNSESGWVELSNRDVVDNLNFEMEDFYELVDYDKSLSDRKEYEKAMKKLASDRNKKKESKAKSKSKK